MVMKRAEVEIGSEAEQSSRSAERRPALLKTPEEAGSDFRDPSVLSGEKPDAASGLRLQNSSRRRQCPPLDDRTSLLRHRTRGAIQPRPSPSIPSPSNLSHPQKMPLFSSLSLSPRPSASTSFLVTPALTFLSSRGFRTTSSSIRCRLRLCMPCSSTKNGVRAPSISSTL